MCGSPRFNVASTRSARYPRLHCSEAPAPAGRHAKVAVPYQHDAFFSYKRDPESDDWHERVKDKVAFWLRLELGRPVDIFFDREDIRTGARWRARLESALRTSRCIVCVWSPLYFQSRWCLSEWKTFAERSQRTRADLVLPASYFDGETFPQEAQEVQFRDFSRFASTMPRFWDTESAVRFENECLRPFAEDLADAIRNAPSFDENFPIVEARDDEVQLQATIGRPANG